ncbi:MAG: tolB protein precursor, periplasmic protein involved in the tonb-independent uptake of group A colicins [uncultured Thermomicrobiales bacterium]|uniref:TolB protein, periplasmic protein involved in the tonb-independent uptake of group A colicins n=1 Tax=uncultured Thermomicrobiales bacterium TaxID=1645740 RepID=A0A6J4VVZ8_9BACT|nr:MAG: tolB protein precursor, periplasmic protein involved in the tonb-independent uptake of group A colicins [uncultured Thermomicrobiales bacterium]
MPTAADHWSREPGRWQAALSPEAYATVPTLATPRPSPGGTRVAYSRAYDGRIDLWVVETGGGLPLQLSDRAPLQGADPNQRHSSAIAWTPDGRDIVYAASGDGKLWIVPADGGPTRAIDEGPGNHHSPAVSPDGRRVAYVAERGEQGDIMVADIGGRWTRTISGGDEYVLQPRWSPDGRSLLYGQWPHYDMPWDERALVVADPDGGERRIIAGGARVVNADAAWSPDGRRIAFVSDRDGDFINLWTIEPDGSNPHRLVHENNRHQAPAWSPDGRRIAYTRNDRGDCQVWCWEGDGTRQLTREPGVWTDLGWLDDDRLVGLFASPTLPADLYTLDARTGERRQLTRSATGGILGGGLIGPEAVEWRSRDGLTIHGLLFTPREHRPGQHPLVVHIHGGPVGQALRNWQGHIQYLVGRGYVILAPNYRGSLGYGRAFMEKLYGDWGGGDLDDYITGAELAIGQGLVNPRKVVAMGGSAGGYSTLICLTKAPDFFRAGVCRFGIADLASFTDRTWVFERHYIAKLMGAPGAHSDLYRDRSPITFVDDVREPLLILQGEDDIVCHPSQMGMMVEALRRAGKEVEYHTYPGEGHGWRRVATHIDDAKRVDDFLVRKVLNR